MDGSSPVHVFATHTLEEAPLASSEKEKKFQSSHKGRKGKQNSEPSIFDILPKSLDFEVDLRLWHKFLEQSMNTPVHKIDSLVRGDHVPLIRQECYWGDHVVVHVPQEYERITSRLESFSFVYTYLFLGFQPPRIL